MLVWILKIVELEAPGFSGVKRNQDFTRASINDQLTDTMTFTLSYIQP